MLVASVTGLEELPAPGLPPAVEQDGHGSGFSQVAPPALPLRLAGNDHEPRVVGRVRPVLPTTDDTRQITTGPDDSATDR